MDKLSKKIKDLRADNNRRLILEALHMNEGQYNKMVFDNGMAWINRYLLNVDMLEYAVSKSTLYWAWWKNQWEMRDRQFIYEAGLERQERPLTGDAMLMGLDLYYDQHNPENITLFPNRFVIDDIRKQLRIELMREVERLTKMNHGK